MSTSLVSSPIQFAAKCQLTAAGQPPCSEVRVFSYIEQPTAVLTEITPTLVTYQYISKVNDQGGYRKEIARLLRSACELHLLGQLESDPASEEASYNGAAVFVGMAAELFIRRWLGWHHPARKRPVTRGVQSSRPRPLSPPRKFKIIRLMLQKARPSAFKRGYDRKKVVQGLVFIMDLRDCAAHPIIDFSRRRRNRGSSEPTQGNVATALSLFGFILKEAGWVP